MDISYNLICPCNNKLYSSLQGLKAHHKTQGHQFWEKNKEQKDLKAKRWLRTGGAFNIKINRLEIENGHLRRLNILLLERLKTI
jgi:hypothetical protein